MGHFGLIINKFCLIVLFYEPFLLQLLLILSNSHPCSKTTLDRPHQVFFIVSEKREKLLSYDMCIKKQYLYDVSRVLKNFFLMMKRARKVDIMET
jgi:hypothetical protein